MPTATATGLNLSLVMRYFPHGLNGITPANLRFFKSTDAGANWQPCGISSSGPGYAQLSGVDGFSRWTLGDVLRPLPVGLTSFRAVRQGPQTLVSRTTATETNNRGFEVEVSTDGRQFRGLGFVPGQEGTAPQPRTYQFLDCEANKQGLRYYHLRQEDLDGKTSYLGPVTVSFQEAQATQLAAYPTAFAGRLTVELTTPAATPVAFTLTDALGRVVWQQTQPVAASLNKVDLILQCFAGTYILTARLRSTVLRQ